MSRVELVKQIGELTDREKGLKDRIKKLKAEEKQIREKRQQLEVEFRNLALNKALHNAKAVEADP